MPSMINTFERARTLIMEEEFSFVLIFTSDDVDDMSEPDWLALREEAREYGLELQVDDDGDAIVRAR